MIKLIKFSFKACMPHAAALVWIFRCTSVTAALISCRVMVFCLLAFDSREASKLTSLSRTLVGRLKRVAKKSAPFIPAGKTCRRDESVYIFIMSKRDLWEVWRHCNITSVPWKIITCQTCTHCYCFSSNLFVDSVDEFGVWTNPDPLLGRNHTCSWDRSLHFVFPSVTFVKTHSKRKEWASFYLRRQPEARAGQKRVEEEWEWCFS